MTTATSTSKGCSDHTGLSWESDLQPVNEEVDRRRWQDDVGAMRSIYARCELSRGATDGLARVLQDFHARSHPSNRKSKQASITPGQR